MTKLLAAVILCAAPAFADETTDLADRLRSWDGAVYVKDGDKVLKVSREAALSAVYGTLAGSEYAQARDSSDPEEASAAKEGVERAEAARSEAFKDAEAVSIDPKELTKSSCGRVCGWYGCRWVICTPNAIAGVRGGRKLDTTADKTLASLGAEVQEVSRGFMKRSPGAIRAAPHIRAGRLYERMAEVAAGKPVAKAEPEDRELTPREVYAKAGPAVVVIMAADKDGKGELGTGSVIDAEGRVLTNAHVVVDDKTGRPFPNVRFYTKPAKVTGSPKEDLKNPREARVAKYDRGLDLALLEPVDPLREVPAVTLGDSESMSAGDPVVAIGHPEQGGLWTLTTGVVSTIVADLGGVSGKHAFQTDASINRGNSGGPLLDRRGRVIGVNTSMSRKAADGLTITSVNFAVRAAVAKKWLGQADADETPVAEAPEPKAEPKKAEPPLVAKKPEAEPKSEPKILTEAKPYKIEDTLEREMAEMEDLEKEMRGEIERRR